MTSPERTVGRRRGAAAGGLVVVALLGQAVPSRSQEVRFDPTRDARRAVAVRIDEPIVVDGKLGEPAWQGATPAVAFSQQQPDEGSLTTQPSEVRFLFDDSTLYVGGTFHDDDPVDGPITNELKRDFATADGDLIALVLDTFHDRRNAFNFMTNPAGAQYDSQSYDDGRDNNPNWDGVWFVKTSRFEGGWTMEMAIPFRTLRFSNETTQEWGMNVFRLIRRKNEFTAWSPIPRQFTQFKVSYAGVLTGISGIRSGRSLRFKPFATSRVSRGLETKASGWSSEGNGGLDFKYALGTSLVMDASYRTDFSQVEADEQQINLTRSSLFFPEKREFFLENQGAFRIGDLGGERRELLPFFSRRIGLSKDGQPIPVFGGARLTGKSGPYGIGLLQMWTERLGETPATSYTALRVTREIGSGSSIGAYYLGTEFGGGFNRAAGVDVHVNFKKTKDVYGYFVKSASPGTSGRDWAGRAALSIQENRYRCQGSYSNIGPDYRNDLGFVSRQDVGWIAGDCNLYFRPRATSHWMRQFIIINDAGFIENSGHDQLLSRTFRSAQVAEFPDGGRIHNDLIWNYEYLTEPLEISRGIFLPPGPYRFREFVPTVSSNKSKWISGNVGATLGEFWSGHLNGFTGGVRLRVNEHLAASATYRRDDVVLPEGAFVATIGRVRVDWSFSTRMFLNAFVQYNSATRSWLSNIRFNLIHRPLSDIFVVYNTTQSTSREPMHAVIMKYTHLFSF